MMATLTGLPHLPLTTAVTRLATISTITNPPTWSVCATVLLHYYMPVMRHHVMLERNIQPACDSHSTLSATSCPD